MAKPSISALSFLGDAWAYDLFLRQSELLQCRRQADWWNHNCQEERKPSLDGGQGQSQCRRQVRICNAVPSATILLSHWVISLSSIGRLSCTPPPPPPPLCLPHRAQFKWVKLSDVSPLKYRNRLQSRYPLSESYTVQNWKWDKPCTALLPWESMLDTLGALCSYLYWFWLSSNWELYWCSAQIEEYSIPQMEIQYKVRPRSAQKLLPVVVFKYTGSSIQVN